MHVILTSSMRQVLAPFYDKGNEAKSQSKVWQRRVFNAGQLTPKPLNEDSK